MTIASVLIQAAYREGNLIPVGTSPTANETTEALERLNRYISAVFGFEMGEELTDWLVPVPQRTAPVAANFPQAPWPTDDAFGFGNPLSTDPSAAIYPYPPANSRIIFGGVAQTIYFPEQPNDGARMAIVQGSGAGDTGTAGAVLTVNGNSRTITKAATTTFTFAALPNPTVGVEYLYRADLGDWRLVGDMLMTAECPFPKTYDDLWICALAIRLAPRYSKAVMPETTALFKSTLSKLKAKYRQTAPTTYGSTNFPNARESYISGSWLQ
jgi:hypothetical protein